MASGMKNISAQIRDIHRDIKEIQEYLLEMLDKSGGYVYTLGNNDTSTGLDKQNG